MNGVCAQAWALGQHRGQLPRGGQRHRHFSVSSACAISAGFGHRRGCRLDGAAGYLCLRAPERRFARTAFTQDDASATRRRATSHRCRKWHDRDEIGGSHARPPSHNARSYIACETPSRLASGPGGPGATQEWKVPLPMLFVHANRRTCSTVRLSAGEGSCKSARWRLRLPHS